MFTHTLFLVSQTFNFHKPLDIPLSIGAYFGDLRPNHFHMGIDYRTDGVEGLKLYSIEDGYVARVKVTPYGYGKVVYVNHPNGITSVYAHCSKFVGRLDSLVRQSQIQQKNNEIELHLKSTDIPLKRGEVFALSGNTGSSTGPHLHFELRETITDSPLNPLLYGLGNKDSQKPTISSVNIYCVSKEGYLIPGKSKTFSISNGKIGSNNSVALNSNFALMHGGLGLGISGYDSHPTGSCGLYENKISCHDKLLFHSKLDKVSFEETRYINTYKDYGGYKNGLKIHKLFKNSMNRLNTYRTNSKGFFRVFPCDSIPIEIETIDAYQNNKKLNFGLQIQGGDMDTTKNFFPEKNYWLPNNSYNIQLKSGRIIIDPNSLYEPTKNKITDHGNSFTFGDVYQGIQNPVVVKMAYTNPKKLKKEKFFIGHFDGSKYDYIETNYEKDSLIAKVLKFGTYKVIIDTIKPKIQAINYTKSNFTGKNKNLIWTISDNESKVQKYDVFINGEWTPASFEYKNKQLSCKFECPAKNVDCLRIEVIDVCGNKAVLESEINFK
jgi:hypothetical protein